MVLMSDKGAYIDCLASTPQTNGKCSYKYDGHEGEKHHDVTLLFCRFSRPSCGSRFGNVCLLLLQIKKMIKLQLLARSIKIVQINLQLC